ncbi:MAG: hypothetical protein GY797_38420 [Deltaproteobacteria bacterium]|nr:hypothetical protein [Deltaproteobacteria bacterium]
MTLEHKTLLELLMYNPWTGLFYWKETREGLAKKYEIAGSEDAGYIDITVNGRSYKAHRLAWFYVYGYFRLSICKG